MRMPTGCTVTRVPARHSGPAGRVATAIVLAGCALLLLSGCATTKMDRLMPHVETMQLATHYFGVPTSKSDLSNGGARNEWLLDQVTQVPGQYVEQKIFVGYDYDGFPVYYTRNVFVPAHMARQYCRLVIVSDKAGNVLESTWEGDSCEDMMAVPSTY